MEAGAEGGQQDEVARVDSALVAGLPQGEGDRGGTGVAVMLNIDVLLIVGHGESLLDRIDDAQVDSYGYVMATIPATVTEEVPVVGFIADLATSPEVSGENINAQVIEKYTGGDIVINKELNSIIKESENEELKK